MAAACGPDLLQNSVAVGPQSSVSSLYLSILLPTHQIVSAGDPQLPACRERSSQNQTFQGKNGIFWYEFLFFTFNTKVKGWCYALFYLFWVWAWYLWLSPNRRTEDAWIYPFLNWNQPGWPIFYFGIPVFWCDPALQVLHGGGVLSASCGAAGRACTRCAPGSSRGASRHRGRLRTRCCPAPNVVGGAKKVVILFARGRPPARSQSLNLNYHAAGLIVDEAASSAPPPRKPVRWCDR